MEPRCLPLCKPDKGPLVARQVSGPSAWHPAGVAGQGLLHTTSRGTEGSIALLSWGCLLGGRDTRKQEREGARQSNRGGAVWWPQSRGLAPVGGRGCPGEAEEQPCGEQVLGTWRSHRQAGVTTALWARRTAGGTEGPEREGARDLRAGTAPHRPPEGPRPPRCRWRVGKTLPAWTPAAAWGLPLTGASAPREAGASEHC